MKLGIPPALKEEHEELHEVLRKATRESGKLGEAARAVASLMHPHFVKEEEYALPPLGLLPEVVAGEIGPETAAVLSLTDKLEAELPQMLAEHEAIVAALETLAAEARRADRLEYVEFAHKLILHARTEEQVSYPAALLVGKYVKLKLRK